MKPHLLLYLAFNIDCESSQPAVRDLPLGRRAIEGFAAVLEEHGLRGSFHVLPGDAEAHAAIYRDLRRRGHEIGLHVHPAADGYQDFLGLYGPDIQRRILADAADRVAQALGERPVSVVPGYASINDHTFAVLHELGFRHGSCSFPTRVLPECASIHAGAPLDVHYAHRFNRALAGDLDFVNIPFTVDPDSRMWGGKHPQDLRVELVDAKNHYYLMKKSIERQIAAGTPVKVLRGITHNTFDYSDAGNFRRETLAGLLVHAKTLAEQNGLTLAARATGADIAAAFRAAAPLGNAQTESGDRDA